MDFLILETHAISIQFYNVCMLLQKSMNYIMNSNSKIKWIWFLESFSEIRIKCSAQKICFHWSASTIDSSRAWISKMLLNSMYYCWIHWFKQLRKNMKIRMVLISLMCLDFSWLVDWSAWTVEKLVGIKISVWVWMFPSTINRLKKLIESLQTSR